MTTCRLVVLTLLTATVAWAQDDGRVLLRYQWNAGDEIEWIITTETTGTVVMRDRTRDPVEETEMPIWNTVTMPMTLRVVSVDEDGSGTIVYEIGVMEADVSAGGGEQYIRIDPREGTMTVDGEEQPMPPGVAEGMAGPIRTVMSTRGEVLEVDLPEGMQAMMGAMGAEVTQWMSMSQQQPAFPERAIGIGHVWGASLSPLIPAEADTEAEATGPVGDVSVLYQLTGIRRTGDADSARIEMLGAMDFGTLPMPGIGMMPGAGEGGDLQMTMGPMHVSMFGAFDFNPAAGRVVGSEMTVIMDMTQQMKGTVETPEGEQRVDMEIITRDMTVKVKVEPVQ